MDCCNFLIAGSGPSGVAAARVLENHGVSLVDAGDAPAEEFPYARLTDALRAGDIPSLLGKQWETLANIRNPHAMHVKLRARGMRYVAQGEPFHVHGSSGEILLRGAGSYAAGGLSNNWGAQLVRYTDADLSVAGGWPISAAELTPWYDDLERHIGIAGAKDDLYGFLGDAHKLLPPLALAPCATYLLRRYASCRAKGKKMRIILGRPRLAVLTIPYDGRAPYRYGETELLTTGQDGIYTAKHTLNALRERKRVTLFDRHKLLAFAETAEYVSVELLDIERNEKFIVRAKHLLIGCGAVHTARLVLLHHNDTRTSLPFLDHPPTLIPIFFPRMFGSVLPSSSFPVQLAATLDDPSSRIMISLYYPGSTLRSDLLPQTPLPMSSSMRLFKNLFGGMLVAQIWETSRPSPENSLQIDASGSIRIRYAGNEPCSALPALLRAFRPLGGWSLARWADTPLPGWGFHYAACLPMRPRPGRYETHRDGRLWNSRRVRVIDASVLPSLPAKNHSLTAMANAARIADAVLRCEY